MVLADTNVWVYFLNGKNKDQKLGPMLWAGEIVTHWIVIGELAVGSVADRQTFMADLQALERVEPATEREALVLIGNRRLYGRGLGWNDIQLLASCLIHQVRLWTHDRRLNEAAQELGCAWKG
jgi:predicted nucleic acid-binding protein